MLIERLLTGFCELMEIFFSDSGTETRMYVSDNFSSNIVYIINWTSLVNIVDICFTKLNWF